MRSEAQYLHDLKDWVNRLDQKNNVSTVVGIFDNIELLKQQQHHRITCKVWQKLDIYSQRFCRNFEYLKNHTDPKYSAWKSLKTFQDMREIRGETAKDADEYCESYPICSSEEKFEFLKDIDDISKSLAETRLTHAMFKMGDCYLQYFTPQDAEKHLKIKVFNDILSRFHSLQIHNQLIRITEENIDFLRNITDNTDECYSLASAELMYAIGIMSDYYSQHLTRQNAEKQIRIKVANIIRFRFHPSWDKIITLLISWRENVSYLRFLFTLCVVFLLFCVFIGFLLPSRQYYRILIFIYQ